MPAGERTRKTIEATGLSNVNIAPLILKDETSGANLLHTHGWQQNRGIRLAASSYVFLSDDDMEYPPDYLSILVRFLQEHPDTGAVSGVWLDAGQGRQPAFNYPTISFKNLLWNFIFQLTVWADLDTIQPTLLNRLLLGLIKKFYAARKTPLPWQGGR